MPVQKRMPLIDTLQVLQSVRTDEIVVTQMGTARDWSKLGSHPLDFIFVPSSMGQGPALGLGLALARPDKRVVVCNGDGSMLMNLGSLVSITALAPPNLTLLLFDNGCYEVTGAQLTPAAAAARSDQSDVDFTAIARACGFSSVFSFDDLEKWRGEIRNVLDATGPTFAVMKVEPIRQAGGPKSPGPGKERAMKFRTALTETHQVKRADC